MGPADAQDRLTPEKIYQVMLAYKHTALLRAGLELRIFATLADGPLGPAEVAQRTGTGERASALLLKALASIGLVEPAGELFTLAEGAESYLVPGRPGYVGDMAKVMASSWEWDAMWRLPDAVRHGGAVVTETAETPQFRYWEDFAAYAGAVAAPMARTVAKALAPWAAWRNRLDVLDVACGHGLYGYTLAAEQPHAQVWSLDWPNVLPVTARNAERFGMAKRAHLIAGDMFEVPFGGPYDVVMITNVLHHFSEERCIELLRRAAAVTAPGGRLVVVGFTVEDNMSLDDAAAHLFSLLMLVWTTAGQVHSASAYRKMITTAGYVHPEVHGEGRGPLRMIIAEKASDHLRAGSGAG